APEKFSVRVAVVVEDAVDVAAVGDAHAEMKTATAIAQHTERAWRIMARVAIKNLAPHCKDVVTIAPSLTASCHTRATVFSQTIHTYFPICDICPRWMTPRCERRSQKRAAFARSRDLRAGTCLAPRRAP